MMEGFYTTELIGLVSIAGLIIFRTLGVAIVMPIDSDQYTGISIGYHYH
jgi:hypothetical protein